MMTHDDLDALAAELGLSPSGLRKRINTLGLRPERGSRGRVVMTPDLAATLREADRLMGEGAGSTTVRRRLGISSAGHDPDMGDRGDGRPGTVTLAPVSSDGHDLREAVAQAIAEQTALAERYAVAAHRVGELEATTRAVEAERDRLARELEQTRANHAAELAQAQALATDQARAVAALAAELAAARRPWWRLW